MKPDAVRTHQRARFSMACMTIVLTNRHPSKAQRIKLFDPSYPTEHVRICTQSEQYKDEPDAWTVTYQDICRFLKNHPTKISRTRLTHVHTKKRRWGFWFLTTQRKERKYFERFFQDLYFVVTYEEDHGLRKWKSLEFAVDPRQVQYDICENQQDYLVGGKGEAFIDLPAGVECYISFYLDGGRGNVPPVKAIDRVFVNRSSPFEQAGVQAFCLYVENRSQQPKTVYLFDPMYDDSEVKVISGLPGYTYRATDSDIPALMTMTQKGHTSIGAVRIIEGPYLGEQTRGEARAFWWTAANSRVIQKDICGAIADMPIPLLGPKDKEDMEIRAVVSGWEFALTALTSVVLKLQPAARITIEFYLQTAQGRAEHNRRGNQEDFEQITERILTHYGNAHQAGD